MSLTLFTGHKRLKFPLVKCKRIHSQSKHLQSLVDKLTFTASKHSLNCLCIRKTINEKSTRMMRVKIKIYRPTLSSRTFITSSSSDLVSHRYAAARWKLFTGKIQNERCTLDRVPITKKKKKKNSTIIISWKSSGWNLFPSLSLSSFPFLSAGIHPSKDN